MSARGKIRRALGRCCECWRRSVAIAEVGAQDAAGKPVGPKQTLHFCQRHADRAVDAMRPVSHKIDVELDTGTLIHIEQDVPNA